MTLALNVVTSYATRRSHEAVLRLVEDLSDEQLKEHSSPTSPSIAFHAWHLARWADVLQSRMPAMTAELGKRLGEGKQIWDAEGLAKQWGFSDFDLGGNATGMGMDDDVSAALPLPDRGWILDYAQRAFEAANRAVEAADEEGLRESCTDLYGRETSVGATIVGHLAHVNRHLGMIEALRGVHGLRGTATV
jgi:DinB family protein